MSAVLGSDDVVTNQLLQVVYEGAAFCLALTSRFVSDFPAGFDDFNELNRIKTCTIDQQRIRLEQLVLAPLVSAFRSARAKDSAEKAELERARAELEKQLLSSRHDVQSLKPQLREQTVNPENDHRPAKRSGEEVNLDDTTNAALWAQAVAYGYAKKIAEVLPEPSGSLSNALAKEANDLAATYDGEMEGRRPIASLLRRILWVDSAQVFVYKNRSPSISVCRAAVKTAQAVYVYTAIDIKPKNKSLNDACLGQVLGYLYRIARAQPLRNRFTGMVSNVDRSVFVVLERGAFGHFKITHFAPVNWITALLHLRQLISDAREQPPDPGFSEDLGAMLNYLATTRRSTVGEFCDAGWRAAPHCELSLRSEIEILKKISPNAPPSLPQLVYYAKHHQEYRMLPVGAPANPVELKRRPFLARSVLQDVLQALEWLHKHVIVHRDVQWSNIVVVNECHGVLVDFRSAIELRAIELRAGDEKVPYQGGVLCCPPRLLCNVEHLYLPARADDYHAFVLLVNAMMLPTAFPDVVACRVIDLDTDEHDRLVRFWDDLKACHVWGQFVTAAEDEDVGKLRVLINLCAAPEYWTKGNLSVAAPVDNAVVIEPVVAGVQRMALCDG
ncbi:hypothetical protein FN846DRAFT_893341 [Sphaerosporella brunnea]|uniref:Protein kinase domain-containing protein n=1 Tax=Sphaerosporella brunnea TaxID=1250544 RepID=A0A5J5EL20_9PEZI|nr:hypothetical protein FN846DRAFT_893341 [Sphaerosporella brunnea]